ncbi:hypothetical protein R1sor_004575 [Riccia sorocarpa]|uniref:Uncharacterized protein n=1 Tax=Riccia sorocarpa TaxID=122646 RepID=A0ABD3HL30_9MARC
MQVLRAWRALQKKIIIKRFNEARALQKFAETETSQMSAECEVVRVTIISAPRPQPRRPAFLYEDDNQTKDTKTGLKARDHIVNSISPANNPHFVAKEIEWMLEYGDLKVQLLKLRTELALLLDTRFPGILQLSLLNAVLSRIQDLWLNKAPTL